MGLSGRGEAPQTGQDTRRWEHKPLPSPKRFRNDAGRGVRYAAIRGFESRRALSPAYSRGVSCLMSATTQTNGDSTDDEPTAAELLEKPVTDDTAALSGTQSQYDILAKATDDPTQTVAELADAVDYSDQWVQQTLERANADRVHEGADDDESEFNDQLANAVERVIEDDDGLTVTASSESASQTTLTGDSGVELDQPGIEASDGEVTFNKASAAFTLEVGGPGGTRRIVNAVEYCEECDELHPVKLTVDPATTGYAMPPACGHESQHNFDSADEAIEQIKRIIGAMQDEAFEA